MKKLSILFIALLICGSAYGLNETANNGPQNITSCYMVGTAACTSGNVVVLQTTSPTYPGKEVTYSTVDGDPIYGVVVDTDSKSPEDMRTGEWIRVQTYGYNSAILVNTMGGTGSGVSAGTVLGTLAATSGSEAGKAAIISRNSSDQISGTTIALSAYSANGTTGTVEGFIGW